MPHIDPMDMPQVKNSRKSGKNRLGLKKEFCLESAGVIKPQSELATLKWNRKERQF